MATLLAVESTSSVCLKKHGYLKAAASAADLLLRRLMRQEGCWLGAINNRLAEVDNSSSFKKPAFGPRRFGWLSRSKSLRMEVRWL